MSNWILEHIAEIIFGLISAGCLAFCKHLWSQNKKMKELTEEKRTREWRNMILEEIDPLVKELTTIREDLHKTNKELRKTIQENKAAAEATHEQMYAYLDELQEGNQRNFKSILNSYKFRLIQLCKTHLADGYISLKDFEQLSEFYKLYHDLGGNGQAEEMYKLAIDLPIQN